MTPEGFNTRTRVQEYGGGAYLVDGDLVVVSDFATGRLNRVAARRARQPLTPDGPGATPTWSLDRGPQPPDRRPRGPRAGDARTPRRGRERDRRDRPRRTGEVTVLARGRRLLRRAAALPGRDAPRLARVATTRTCPGTGRSCASREIERRRLDSATPGPSPAASRLDLPAALVARRRSSTSSPSRRLDEPPPARRRRGSSRSRPGRPSSPTRTGCSASRTTPSWPTARSSRSAGAAAATGSYRIVRDGRDPRADRRAVHRDRRDHVRRRRASSCAAAPPTPRRRSSSSTRRRPRTRRPALDATAAFDPADIAVPRAGRVPDDRRPDRVRPPATCRRAVDYAGPGRRAAAADRHEPRRPDRAGVRGLTSRIQLFTSRGFAVLDVDYGGSTGYGKEYRKRLEGEWGVVDLDDCVAGARWLAEQGLVDGERLAIRGGSASGYTTLCALDVQRRVQGRRRATSGSATSRRSRKETHKFESRYLDDA